MVVALIKKGEFQEAETMLGRLAEVNPGNVSLAKLRNDLEAERAASKQSASKGR